MKAGEASKMCIVDTIGTHIDQGEKLSQGAAAAFGTVAPLHKRIAAWADQSKKLAESVALRDLPSAGSTRIAANMMHVDVSSTRVDEVVNLLKQLRSEYQGRGISNGEGI